MFENKVLLLDTLSEWLIPVRPQLNQIGGTTFAARAREDVLKLDTQARRDMLRLRHIALVSFWLLLFFQTEENFTKIGILIWVDLDTSMRILV